MKPAGDIDLVRFRVEVRDALSRARLDAETVASVFGSVVAICSELQRYRDGAQRRTMDEALQVAALDRELAALPPNERNVTVMARLGLKRSKLYRLRGLARRPVLNGNPDPNGTHAL